VDRQPGSRRPPCNTLYDVFSNIRDDEMEHVSTMKACQEYATLGVKVISPHEKYLEQVNTNSPSNNNNNNNNNNNSRKKWIEWADTINEEAKRKEPIELTPTSTQPVLEEPQSADNKQ
jgi:hypothetical protein